VSFEVLPLFTGIPALCDGFRFGASTVALCRGGGRNVLFDTGPYAYRPLLLERLAQLGLGPGDIDTLVLSHLHWDHALNADLFPRARVLVHEDEVRYAERPAGADWATPPYIVRSLGGLRVEPFRGEPEVAPGLRLLELPGHSPGLVGLLAEAEGILLASDAVLYARNAVRGRLDLCFGDPEQAAASLRRALRAAALLLPGHDRPFRPGPPPEYVGEFRLRMRLFLDPAGQDQEVVVASEAARGFTGWPG
jgi:N-acyl homoserine lactone hydrolase